MPRSPTNIAPDVAAEIARWLGYLGAERRMSPKTLEAYRPRRGAVPRLSSPSTWAGRRLSSNWPSSRRPTCAPSWRRGAREGAGSRSLMRGLAGARSFARFLERNGKGKVAALTAVRAPKLARSLPKPIAGERRQAHDRCRACAPAKRASPGSSRATPPCWPALRRGPAHFRSARPARQDFAARHATRSPSPARATRRAWCRCCRRSPG